MKHFIFHILLCASLSGKSLEDTKGSAEEIYSWKKIEYENLPKPENSMVGPYRYYIPENNDILGFGYHPASGVMFVALGRLRPGSPATTAAFCARDYKSGSSPKFWPFPDYETNELRASDFYGQSDTADTLKRRKQTHHFYDWSDKRKIWSHNNYHKPMIASETSQTDYRIISVYQMNIDEKCNRLFFVDVGVLNYFLVGNNVIQKPAILVYDIPYNACKTRQFNLIRRVEIPETVATQNPFGILYTTIDYQSEDCDDLFLYMQHFDSFIIVYDFKRNDFWSFSGHPSFLPVTAESFFVYEKTFHYQLREGLMSIALGYPDRNGDRTAFYITGASTAQYAVSTRILKDKRKSPTNYNPDDFKLVGYRGCLSNAGKMVVDYIYGVIIYAERQSTKIRCWNISKPLNPDNMGVMFQSDNVQYPITMFKDSQGYVWFHSCRLPIIAFTNQTLDLTQTNYRFYRMKISHGIKGTVCDI